MAIEEELDGLEQGPQRQTVEPHGDERKVHRLGDKEQPDRNSTGKASLTDVLMEINIGACGWAVRVTSNSAEAESVLLLVIREHRFQLHY